MQHKESLKSLLMDPQQRQQYHVLHSSIASIGTDQLN